jgi:hypothetical protein
LVVEDSDAIRLPVVAALAAHGFELAAAPDGIDLERLLPSFAPDLVILSCSKSPEPTTSSNGVSMLTANVPPLGDLARGVLYAFHVLPPSRVARTLAIVEPPVAIQAFLPPCVVTQVPLEAKENSPGNAAGILLLISCQVVPSVVRRSGNTPFAEWLCAMPRCGVQKAKPSSKAFGFWFTNYVVQVAPPSSVL